MELEPLDRKVDTLASEFAQIKALLLNLQPSRHLGPAGTAAPESPHEGAPQHWVEGDDLASLTGSHGWQKETRLHLPKES